MAQRWTNDYQRRRHISSSATYCHGEIGKLRTTMLLLSRRHVSAVQIKVVVHSALRCSSISGVIGELLTTIVSPSRCDTMGFKQSSTTIYLFIYSYTHAGLQGLCGYLSYPTLTTAFDSDSFLVLTLVCPNCDSKPYLSLIENSSTCAPHIHLDSICSNYESRRVSSDV